MADGRSLTETAEEVLRRRAESLARESLEEEISDLVSLLLFRLGDEWYAVKVGDVREIFQEYEITRIPSVPDFVLGVVNVRGEILSVTDPSMLMRLGSVSFADVIKPPAIVITFDEVATAMVVDEIGDIAEIPSDAIEPPVSIIDRAQADFIAASAHVGDSMVGVINIERMLEPIVFAGRH